VKPALQKYTEKLLFTHTVHDPRPKVEQTK